jgi:F-type H+-transporting ATPase subunit b
MLIDWFTVAAQALNFLILVWLMKRFLYKPILNAIDAREKLIAKNSRTPMRKRPKPKRNTKSLKRKTRSLTSNAPHFSRRQRTRRESNASGSSTKREKRPML